MYSPGSLRTTTGSGSIRLRRSASVQLRVVVLVGPVDEGAVHPPDTPTRSSARCTYVMSLTRPAAWGPPAPPRRPGGPRSGRRPCHRGGEDGAYAGVAQRLVRSASRTWSSPASTGAVEHVSPISTRSPQDSSSSTPVGPPVAGGWARRRHKTDPISLANPGHRHSSILHLVRYSAGVGRARSVTISHSCRSNAVQGELGVRCPAQRTGERGITIDGPDLGRCAEA